MENNNLSRWKQSRWFSHAGYCILDSLWATVCRTVRRLSVRCLSVSPVCLSATLVYFVVKQLDGSRRNLAKGRPPPRPHCVRWGPSSALSKGAQPPIFGPCLLWPNGWLDQDVIWYKDIGVGPGNIVLDATFITLVFLTFTHIPVLPPSPKK